MLVVPLLSMAADDLTCSVWGRSGLGCKRCPEREGGRERGGEIKAQIENGENYLRISIFMALGNV